MGEASRSPYKMRVLCRDRACSTRELTILTHKYARERKCICTAYIVVHVHDLGSVKGGWAGELHCQTDLRVAQNIRPLVAINIGANASHIIRSQFLAFP